MSVLSSISALKNKVNQYIKANYQQLITGPVINSILHDIIDTISSSYEGTYNAENLNIDNTYRCIHNRATITPEVTIYNNLGIREMEINITIICIDENTIDIIHPAPITGTYHIKVK